MGEFKPILCLDFDGVIHSYTSGWKGPRNIPDLPIVGSIEFIHRMLNAGWDVVIHSSRCRYIGGPSAIRRWLKFHAGNIYYEHPGGVGIESVRIVRMKPPAKVTIDDRALTFTGEWPTTGSLEAFEPYREELLICAACGLPDFHHEPGCPYDQTATQP